MEPLAGIIVLDFSQFLAGPSAALRLADLGARVIKVERPGTGDSSRKLALNNLTVDGDSVLFHTINRNKESFAADLKNPADLAQVRALIRQADVMIENFRPGVMTKIGLDYAGAQSLNPRLVYATVTGYGNEGPWSKKPGQDLLVQALSGLTWLNGNGDQPPTPFALSVADSMAGVHLAQGIMACLIRRAKSGAGGLVEVSLLESLLSMQFEVLTTWLNDGRQTPRRSRINNAHAYLSAPYGIYGTADGHIALAMGSVTGLGQILDCPALARYADPAQWFSRRDEIKDLLAAHLASQTTAYWLTRLERHGYWCADVYNWQRLSESPGFQALKMVQHIQRPGSQAIRTLRCPIRFNRRVLSPEKWAPGLGEDNHKIIDDFHLGDAI